MDWNKYIKSYDRGTVHLIEGDQIDIISISVSDYEMAVADKIAMKSKNLEIERLRIQVTSLGKRKEKLEAETTALHKDRKLILQDSDEFMYLMKDLNYIIKEKDNKIKELEEGGGSCAAPAPGRIQPEDPGQDPGGPESKGSRAAESAPDFEKDKNND